MTHQQRAEILKQSITVIRAQAHLLLEAELWGALDETARALTTLERQYELFMTLEPVPVEVGS